MLTCPCVDPADKSDGRMSIDPDGGAASAGDEAALAKAADAELGV